MKACVQNRKSGESPKEWGKVVKQRFQQPTVSLRSYGGGELNIVSQVKCCVSRVGVSLIYVTVSAKTGLVRTW